MSDASRLPAGRKADVAKHVAEHGQVTVTVLADSTKLDRRLFATIGGLEIADYLVTSTAPTGALGKALAKSSVEVLAPDTKHRLKHRD